MAMSNLSMCIICFDVQVQMQTQIRTQMQMQTQPQPQRQSHIPIQARGEVQQGPRTSEGQAWNQSMVVQLTRAGNWRARTRKRSPTGLKHSTTCRYLRTCSQGATSAAACAGCGACAYGCRQGQGCNAGVQSRRAGRQRHGLLMPCSSLSGLQCRVVRQLLRQRAFSMKKSQQFSVVSSMPVLFTSARTALQKFSLSSCPVNLMSVFDIVICQV